MAFAINKFPFFFWAMLAAASQPSIATQVINGAKIYSPQERVEEEKIISKKIEERLDWKNRSIGQLDDVDDADRMLIGGLDVSILLRRSTGERFGVYEAIRNNGRKSVEIRMHLKNKLTDRFQLYGDSCQGASIHAEQVKEKFAVYETACTKRINSGKV
jgi:hypothetical protein